MISGDVAKLADGPEGSGCYATLLTNRGAIVADLHVARIGEVFWIESARGQISNIKQTLERFIIADDVELIDQSDAFAAWGLEGPAAEVLLGELFGSDAKPALPAPSQWSEVDCLGTTALVGAFGMSGERAFQLRVPVEKGDALKQAIVSAAAAVAAKDASGEPVEFRIGDFSALEVLRVEAGIPALEQELLGALPPEARLEHAISTDKGCYVGQEIVARLRSRGQVNHLLVGLRFEGGGAPPAPGAELRAGDRKTGRVTSRATSPSQGEIALGFVRRENAEAGTRVAFEGGEAIVVELPFVPLPAIGDRVRESA
jgi:aminomethyltransferase